jgi:hypothetical protein
LPNAANLLARVLADGIASSVPPLTIFWRGLKGRSPHEQTSEGQSVERALTLLVFNLDY